MVFKADNKSPIYMQIIKYIKVQIVTGEIRPGDTVLSRREMALSLNVNLNTVQRAYKEMESMGIINTFKNYQSNITTNENIINNLKVELINESLESFIENMKLINVSKDEIIKIIDERY